MNQILDNLNTLIVILALAVSLFVLSKSADYLVDNAVKLSLLVGLPELVIGATIVSVGTTLPELSASVTSSLQGNGSFAMGNAIGSIITNTSLILGTGALFGKIPVDKKSSQKLIILVSAILLLVIPSIPYKIISGTGYIPRWMGIVLLVLFPIYLYFLMVQDKKHTLKRVLIEKELEVKNNSLTKKRDIPEIIIKIIASALFIAGSAAVLVSSAEILAVRAGIPNVVIASTLVAFGTSVPEFSTCIAAVRRKNGGLALGNILGADILNILLVTGASIILIPNGLSVDNEFYTVHFIVLAVVLAFFTIFSFNKYPDIRKREGIILIVIYLSYVVANLLRSVSV